MVDVFVNFDFMRKEWTHKFHADKGSTIRALKELLLQSRGTEADLACFELREEGGRAALPDGELLQQDQHVHFRWLSEKRRARRAARAAQKENAPVDRIEVTVRHAQPDKESSITVSVPVDACFLDVRREVMARLGEDAASEVRLVARKGSSFASLPDRERVRDRRELLSLGRRLDSLQERGQKGEVWLSEEQALCLQRELLEGFSAEAFQRELSNVEKEHGRGSRVFLMKRQALCLTVQSRVLPKYGFEGTPKGVVHMMKAMEPYGPALAEGGQRIEELLGMRDPGSEAKPAGPGGVSMVVQWDPTDHSKEATCYVESPATVFKLKEVLCRGDPTGKARPDHFHLASVKSLDKILDNDLLLSEQLGTLRCHWLW